MAKNWFLRLLGAQSEEQRNAIADAAARGASVMPASSPDGMDGDSDDWGDSPSHFVRTSLRDIPISAITEWDSVSKVRAALNELEIGRYQLAATLVDGMGRDDRFVAVLSQRIHNLLGCPISWEGDNEAANEWFEENWCHMLSESAAFDLLKWGELLNAGVGELIWDTEGDDWVPRIKVWHPKYLWWNWGTRSYWISTMDGQVEVTPGDGKWFLYTPYGYERGWLGARVRALAIPFLIRQFAYRDWARYSEVHGLPIRGGVVPESAQEEIKERFLRELCSLGSESVVKLPKGPAGDGFDVKLVEATALGWEAFEGLIEKAESSIAITLLGQNLTTEVTKSGGIGSGGGSSVHEAVAAQLARADAKSWSYSLREQVFEPTAAFNFGDPEAAPSICYDVEPPDDLAASSKMLLDLGGAVTALKAAGMAVDVDTIAEQFNVPVLTGAAAEKMLAEEAAKAAAQANPAPADAAGGLDDPSPSGASPAGGRGSPEKSAQLARYTTDPATVAHVEGQVYTDAVADHAKPEGADALAPDLATLAALIQNAESYDGLRAALLKAYRKMRPGAFAEVMQKATLLAHLNGWKTTPEEK